MEEQLIHVNVAIQVEEIVSLSMFQHAPEVRI